MRETLVQWYLEFVNDFITVARFAEHHGISPRQAANLIRLGKAIHETPHPES